MAKKVFSTFLCSVMILLTAVMGVSAAEATDDSEHPIQPYYAYTSYTVQDIYVSNGQIACEGVVEGYSWMTTKITITIYLEKKTLFWWSEQNSWTWTYNTYRGDLVGKTALPSSGTYRTKAVYTVYSGSSSETITGYSAELKL